MKPKAILRLSVIAIAFSACAQAADLTWDNGTTTGNWNTTDANWTSAVWNNATPDNAIFNTETGAITLTESITAGNFTFGLSNANTSGAFAGSALSISGNLTAIADGNNGPGGPTLSFSNNVTIGGDLALGRRVVEIANGTFSAGRVLSAGSWGRFLVNGGAVTIANGIDDSINGGNTLSVFLQGGSLSTPYIKTTSAGFTSIGNDGVVLNGGTLYATADSSDFIQTYNPGWGNRNDIGVGTGGANLNTNGFNITISKAMLNYGGAGPLTKSGSGTLKLTAFNHNTGGTTVNEGTLDVSGATGGWGLLRGAITVNSGATLSLTGGDGTGFGWNSPPTSITINAGTVTSEGAMHVWNLPGGVNMTGGTLQCNNGTSNPNGPQMEWINANVTTNASADPATIGGRIRMRADGGVTGITFNVADGDAATDLLISAAVTQASGGMGITKSGPGTMVLSGANNYTGTTTISAGTLSLTNPVLDDNAPVVIASGAKIDLNFVGSDTIGRLEINGSGPLPAGSYDSSHQTYGSCFTGTGSLVVPGANGTWTSQVDGNWSDQANWDGNSVAVGYDASATFNAATGVAVTVDSNRKIGNLVFDVSDYTLNGSGVLTLDASSTPAISVTADRTATISSELAGSLGMQKTGDGTLVLTGIKSYSGGTTVTSGTLELAGGTSGNSIIRGALNISPGATVAITGGDGSGFGWNNPVTSININGGTINAAGSSHIGFGTAAASMILDNGSSVQGSWQWNGGNMLSFSSYGDITNTISGNLNLRADGGASHNFTVNDGASATDLLISGNLSDQWPEVGWVPASGLTKSGSGTMTLSGTNTYDGDTVVNDGTLEVTSSGSLKFRPTTNGATNKVSGTSTASLAFSGTITLDLGAANTTSGNVWNLFNLASFSGTAPVLAPATVTSTLGNFIEVSAGVWELEVSAAKWSFTAADGNLTYTVTATPYEIWGSTYGLTAGSENADADNDGLTNFQEYAFGLNPTNPASSNPITSILKQSDGTFSYSRRLTSLTGLTYKVFYSTTLESGSWTEDTGALQGTPSINGETETVPVTISDSLRTNPKLFIQVRASGN